MSKEPRNNETTWEKPSTSSACRRHTSSNVQEEAAGIGAPLPETASSDVCCSGLPTVVGADLPLPAATVVVKTADPVASTPLDDVPVRAVDVPALVPWRVPVPSTTDVACTGVVLPVAAAAAEPEDAVPGAPLVEVPGIPVVDEPALVSWRVPVAYARGT